MKKLIWLFVLFIETLGISVYARTITGKVIDDSKLTISFANVMLHTLSDSSFVTGTVTEEKGEHINQVVIPVTQRIFKSENGAMVNTRDKQATDEINRLR
ncbi:carboxypeptidase regulatory-like domain-containing protein [Parabacteroides sp. Marseille-P3160]|uniref:carboxypeptidase regulatory-like domain-containing protein n=1 Tax=Parabacteroides sp. Marseille-P3160 TaxID=1917887 RepID=UPI0009BB3188|nr:carboxypeptidase regulatory-like domain-containing protein [Parabacteroides sp. Marseille-P3160]